MLLSSTPSSGSNQTSYLRRNGRVILLGALFLAFALPLSRIGASLWSDEATSVWFARWPLTQLLTALCDPHPPGYYVLLKGWLALGEQEGWLRWPSVAASVLAVALTYRLGRDAWQREIGILAALLLAIYPLQIGYASEARMYILAQALGLVAVILGWGLIQSLEKQQRGGTRQIGQAFGYILVAIIALGVDYTAIFPLFLLQLLWLARGYPRAGRWLLLQAVVLAAAYLLWLDAAHRSALATSFQAFTLAVQLNRLGFDMTPADATALLRAGGLAAILLSLLAAWQWPKRLSGLARFPWFSLLIWLMWLGLLVFMAVPRLYSLKRQLIALLPYLTLVMAYAFLRLPRVLKAATLILTLAVTLFVLPAQQREAWSEILTQLAGQEQAGVIWVDEWAVTPVDYYDRQMQAESGVLLDWHPLLSRNLPKLPATQPQPEGDLWLIMAEGSYRHLLELLPPAFHADYELLEERQAPGIGLYHYQRRSAPLDPAPDLPPPSQTTLWSLESAFPLDVCP